MKNPPKMLQVCLKHQLRVLLHPVLPLFLVTEEREALAQLAIELKNKKVVFFTRRY